MDTRIVTQKTNLLEDIPQAQKPQILLQVERFLEGDANPLSYYSVMYQTFPHLLETVWNSIAMKVEADVELALIRAASEEMEQAQEERAYGNTRAVKPAEIYRKYAAALREVANRTRDNDNQMLARAVLNELFLAQSLSAGELESPDWIDPYTGEVDEDEELDWTLASLPDLMERVEMASPASDEAYTSALQAKKALGWSEADMRGFLRAQRAFDAVESESVFFEDREYVPPTLEKDMQIDFAAFAIATPALAAFSKWRTETFADMQEYGTEGMTWKACFATHKEESAEAAELISTIAEVAHTYDIVTAAAIALKVAGEYGLTENDLDGIGGFTPNGVYYGLNEYIEEWEVDVLGMLQDGMGSRFPMSDIEASDKATMEELAKILPEKHHNPMQTRSYILAYIQAIATGATLRQAEGTALARWREAMSPKGALAYNEAWNATHKMATAWRSFWQQCGPDVPRPKEHVRAVRGNYSGLVLSSGRKVDWRIAAIKIKNNEIEWHPGQREKLKTILAQKGMRNIPVMKYL